MKSGLVSVSFRQKTPLEICALCRKANLSAVEWGGDVHCPPEADAAAVRAMTLDHGLEVSSYGSYYRVGQSLDAFKANLETAVKLGAPVMRVWGGLHASRDMSEAERAETVETLTRCAELSGAANVTLTLEYHGGTLTDDRASVRRLLEETKDVKALKFYWQPRWDWPFDSRLESLDEVLPRLSHLHVFTWEPNGGRLPLSDGEALWTRVFERVPADTYALLEFVQNDSDEALLRDAAVLNRWIGAEK